MARKLRVLHVMNGAAGGAFLSTVSLIEELERQGVDSGAVCHDVGASAERERLLRACSGNAWFAPMYWWNRKIRAAGWKRPLIQSKQAAQTGGLLASTFGVAKRAREFRADLLHTNSFVITEGARAARLMGLPHIWHLREMIGPGQPFVFPLDLPDLGRWVTRHASLVLATSDGAAQPLRPHVPADQLRVVYNGIEMGRSPRDSTRAVGSSTDLVVGMIGHTSARWKRHDLFIAMAARLLDLPLRFAVFGESARERPTDTHSARLVGLSASALGERLRWEGPVPDAADALGRIDILVHPAEGESFGRTVLEAMAAAVPVIGVDAGGVRELIVPDESGLLAPANDPIALAASVRRLALDAPLRQRLGEAGQQRATALFSLDAYARRVSEAYDAALSRRIVWRRAC